MIEPYLQRIRQVVESLAGAQVEFYLEQLLSPDRVNLRFKLTWSSGAFMEVSEAIEARGDVLVWLSYRYHFQDATLLLRYDNAPHYPGLPTYPDHRHQGTQVTAHARPDLETFLLEIRRLTKLW